MMSRSFLRLAVVAAIVLGLTGCSRSESYRYKLTLAVDTPEGVKRASSVVEALFYEVSFPERGTMHKLRGEALYLDLGPDLRPLIALLTSHRQPKDAKNYADFTKGIRWSLDAGPSDNILAELYGPRSADFMDNIARVGHTRGVHGITPNDLPDLVTFADINDPKSVIRVDPNDLQATLGRGITWNAITLESTDEAITTGIAMKLPWLPAYFEKNLRLDGSNHGAKSDLANILSWFEFDQSGDLKRKN
jgi:hypothetical protein